MLEAAKEIAFAAGEVLLKYWGKVKKIETKSYHWDLVTEADKEAENIILEKIRHGFPDHGIISEEAGVFSSESDFVWIVDPLDGTTNFSHNFPMFSVSIGVQQKGQIIAGVVYHPLHGEMFCASRGKGATLNDQKIQVSKVTQLPQSLLATGFAYDRACNPDNNYALFCHFTNISQGVRRLGSAALDLAYVAAGRLDGYWERGLRAWDMAAGSLLVEEAGGIVSSYGEPLDLSCGQIIAANSHLHQAIFEEIKKGR